MPSQIEQSRYQCFDLSASLLFIRQIPQDQSIINENREDSSYQSVHLRKLIRVFAVCHGNSYIRMVTSQHT